MSVDALAVLRTLSGRPHQVAPAPAWLEGRSVLVTGAGGSIGSELVGQVLAAGPRRLVLAELSEAALHVVYEACKARGLGQVEVEPALLDIRHTHAVQMIFGDERPEVVLHAAALKHVPLLETPRNTIEAARTNVLGTKNLFDAACRSGTHSFVSISTDKAVRPTNVMGATKRLAELYVREASYREGAPRTAVVRFGNVLLSSGSVIPLFLKQIAEGRPLTITHAETTRFFMTIPEASSLVLAAGGLVDQESREGARTFVLNMGKPVKLLDFAKALSREAGRDPNDYQITGLRPGEKLHEELALPEETLDDTPVSGVLEAVPLKMVPEVQQAVRVLSLATEDRDLEGVLDVFAQTVEGYR